jgi:hypothetical protein
MYSGIGIGYIIMYLQYLVALEAECLAPLLPPAM